MKDILHHVISLAESRNTEEEHILKKYDPGGVGHLGFNADYLAEPRPKAGELEKYLLGLAQDQLEYVAAIMDGGRSYVKYGERPALEKLLAGVRGQIHLEDAIAKKAFLPDYLRAGMKIYRI